MSQRVYAIPKQHHESEQARAAEAAVQAEQAQQEKQLAEVLEREEQLTASTDDVLQRIDSVIGYLALAS
jgi:hypothetical protein